MVGHTLGGSLPGAPSHSAHRLRTWLANAASALRLLWAEQESALFRKIVFVLCV